MKRREFLALPLGWPAAGQAPAGAGTMLWDYTMASLRALDARRQARFDGIRTAGQVAALRNEVRARLAAMWGAFPGRTPLNPRLVATLAREDYAVEKLLFESRPAFYVTANLYRPAAPSGRLPAVIFPPGHSHNGKASASYQSFCIELVRAGFVALIWDPIGQGERLQFWDPDRKRSAFGPGTPEHFVLGSVCYLLGLNLMHYLLWDAVRAIDYLESRPDVDKDRIAMAGQSGGGMQTLQFAAFDARIKAAFSACAVASFRHKSEALLIADPEQILFRTLEHGIDHPELLAAFAPRPLLVGSALRDYVPIEGARQTFGQVRRIYAILGAEGAAAMAETDDTHGLNAELRAAGVEFLCKWLKAGLPSRQPAVAAPDEELFCTPSGQVSVSLGGETVVTLNRKLADRIAPRLPLPRGAAAARRYQASIRAKILDLTKAAPIEKEPGIQVPVRVTGDGSGGTILAVAPTAADLQAVAGPLARAGYRVVEISLRGWSATAPHLPHKKVAYSWDDFFAYRALEMGRPLFGQRLRDLLAAAPGAAVGGEWTVLGLGEGALLAACAAAIEPRIRRTIAIGGLLSYRSLVDDPHHRHPVSLFLPGVISAYEVRDVYAAIAPRDLLVLDPEDSRRRPAPSAAAEAELAWTARIYRQAGAEGRFTLQCGAEPREWPERIAAWLGAG